MPFGFRLRGFSIVVEVFAGISDELFENLWGNTTNPNPDLSEKTIKLTEKVLKVGVGGSIVTESSKHVNNTYSVYA